MVGIRMVSLLLFIIIRFRFIYVKREIAISYLPFLRIEISVIYCFAFYSLRVVARTRL